MSSPRMIALALLAAVALALAGCGGENGSSEGGEGSSASSETVVIEAEEGAFDPKAIYDNVAPGVVTVTSVFDGGGPPRVLGGQGPARGQGSGFAISEDGEILTNAHVVARGAEAGGGGDLTPAADVYVEFADRNRVQAEIVGFDPDADVALLKIDPGDLVDLELQPVKLASAGEVEVGEPVAAIGSPFSQEQSLSTGVVSAADRSIPSLTRFQIAGAIQTDASINPGNSGGPLLDAEGRVIGINQQINTTSGGNEGVGFAVPIDLVRYSLEQLREDGTAEYAFLGVTTQAVWPQLASELELGVDTGALVVRIVNGGPADEAGLRGSDRSMPFQGLEVEVGGDVIVSVDGERLVAAGDLAERVSRRQPGSAVTLEVIRDGERREIDVELGERSEAPDLDDSG